MASARRVQLDELPATFEEGGVVSETEAATLELRPNRGGDGAVLTLTAEFKASRSESIETTLSVDETDQLVDGLERVRTTLE